MPSVERNRLLDVIYYVTHASSHRWPFFSDGTLSQKQLTAGSMISQGTFRATIFFLVITTLGSAEHAQRIHLLRTRVVVGSTGSYVRGAPHRRLRRLSTAFVRHCAAIMWALWWGCRADRGGRTLRALRFCMAYHAARASCLCLFDWRVIAYVVNDDMRRVSEAANFGEHSFHARG